MDKALNPIIIAAELLGTTDKAYRFDCEGDVIWVGKSVVEWDEDENELYPGQFLGPAEDAGLLEKIDRWTILQSIKLLSEQREGGGKARLFINITHKSIVDDSFLPWMGVALKAAN